MRITLHIGAFTVTIIVKRRENRHYDPKTVEWFMSIL